LLLELRYLNRVQAPFLNTFSKARMECCLLSVMTVAAKRRDFPKMAQIAESEVNFPTHTTVFHMLLEVRFFSLQVINIDVQISECMYVWLYGRSTGLVEGRLSTRYLVNS
jgi:hypothetical protein